MRIIGISATAKSAHHFRSLKPLRLSLKPQRNNAATLRWIPSALAEIQRNPEQPEPPRVSSRYAKPLRSRGGPGENACLAFSPGGFGHFRRAKVALYLQMQSALKKMCICQSGKSQFPACIKTHS